MEVIWFKRDLRVEDNAALATAGAGAVPLYIIEPEYWRLPDTSARQYAFLAEALNGLRDDLGQLGAPLIVRVGDAVDVLDALHATHGLTRLISHEETGNRWTFARDRAVAAWAKGKGIQWLELPNSGVVRRLDNRDGWARHRDAVMRQPQIAPPNLRPHDLDLGGVPMLRDLGLTDDCAHRQRGGRAEALSLLGGFLTERGHSYRSAMSSPLAGEWACSRLSPHFAFGTLSIREAVQAGQARAAEVKGTRSSWIGSLRSFQSRLAWRDHFIQKLEDEPRIETRALHTAYENLRPKMPDADRLHAWENGETGLPFVDACMRFLHATGWLNFRMRSMVMAVASYHLWLDWRHTGPHLARMFTDYEPGIHWSQVQMQSGTTGMNTIRIYNPVKQGQDQDPDGIFTRRWCPELADVPDRFLQEPWAWEGAARLRYPAPIVDVKAAAKAAREAVWAVRRGDAFWNEAQQVVKKHASRKKDRGFQRDPIKKPAAEQLKFDL
ncbi:FAD-binding domain-containing protein [Nereida sp. MMG025]|uniref:FAD-binding domain-containing protein n=1 Tax=Nereida sp. MMG025 TaxID=2909981 RepID=UPI001F1A222D|nr:FAD-binding domain-containing protein [Nereida sp. MMG025]MCF6445254.1 deoxyribodipyrimidine photo-lyase [Nereida sp. MMG025]